MKIEEGKYYRTADGRKVGPMKASRHEDWPWIVVTGNGQCWKNDGTGVGGTGSPDLIEEWVDPWKDLTPEEKGALLLAHHEGKTLQYYNKVLDFWLDTDPTFHPMDILRIKPEPVRKTVTLYGAGWHYEQAEIPCDDDTHRITFDLVDGEPDTDSIKMEKL